MLIAGFGSYEDIPVDGHRFEIGPPSIHHGGKQVASPPMGFLSPPV
jgi:hypothetical protein